MTLVGYQGQETFGTCDWKLTALGPLDASTHVRKGHISPVESVPITQVSSLELVCGALLGRKSVSGQQTQQASSHLHCNLDDSDAVRSLSTVIYSQ